ncbi:protein kinase domain-containing protein [Noviherbaspirillum sp.]|uniref:protein kinase domain-containing protein n=1 Tax=Noviherbaspirillum sp. TaxID=1926288 RepID=UPI002F938814
MNQAAGNSSVPLPGDSRRTGQGQSLPAGARIGQFAIVDLIGDGAAGYVYLAFDASLGRHVALREYLPRGIAVRAQDGEIHPAGKQQQALFAAGLRSFASEALVLARIDSPSLVKVLRYWEGNGSGYAVMPFYEGASLQQAHAERRLPTDEMALRSMLSQLLDGVDAVHRAQSCHGNISPGDILVRADGRPLLLEFDAARTILAEMTQTLPAALKAGYAAVELYPGMPDMQPGAWTDIYALGALAYFLVTGKNPPPAPARLRDDVLKPAREAARTGYSAGLLDAIDRMLAIRPEQRPATVAEARALIGANMPVGFLQRADNARDAIRNDRQAHGPARQSPISAMPPDASNTRVQRPLQQEVLPPIQGEWRKQAITGARRDLAPRRRRLPGALLAAGVLCAGVAVGVVAGYPELLQPAQDDAARSQKTPQGQAEAAVVAQAVPPPVPKPVAAAELAPAAPAARQAVQEPVKPPAPPPADRGSERGATAAAAAEAAQAKTREKEQERLAEAEREEWQVASTIGEPAFYEAYLRRFPDGPNAAAARQKLAAARQSVTRPAPEPATTPPGAARPTQQQPAPAATPSGTAGAPQTGATGSDAVARTAAAGAVPATPEAPRAPGATAPAGGESVASAPRRTLRSENQTLSGEFSTDPESGALTGVGQVAWTNGDRFEGRLVNGSREGKGEFVWSNGQRYSGEWSGNEPNGKGTIIFAGGNRYDGEVRNGLPNGRGVLVFASGGRYEGDIRNGVPNGKGLMVFADGTRYEGEVRDGLPHGQGITRFRTGDVYVGALANGRSHGQGRLSWANGTTWEGEFRDGQRTANGRLVAQSSSLASSGGVSASAGSAGHE